MQGTNINSTKFRTAFLLILVAGVSALFIAVIWPFLQALLFGAIFAGFGRPLFHRMLPVCRDSRGLASFATMVVIFIVIAIPAFVLTGLVVKQAVEVTTTATPWVQEHMKSADTFDPRDWIAAKIPASEPYLPTRGAMLEHVSNAAKAVGGYVLASASTVTKGTAGFLLNTFVMLYAMFYFLKDGRKILETIFYYMPLDHHDELLMLQRFSSVTVATVKGTLVIGLIQGVLGGIGFAVAGINGAVFWGAIMVVLSIIPGIGATLVWAPAVVYLFITGQTVAAVLLAAWCAGVVGTIDNVLRPRLVGKDAEMPDLLILLGTLGGLFLFGPLGFVVGPVVCGLFLTVWQIYGVAFRNILPPVESLKGGLPETIEEPPPIKVKETKDSGHASS